MLNMGLLSGLSNKIIEWAISTVLISVGLVLLLSIPLPQVPLVLMLVLVCKIIAWCVARILGVFN